MPWENVSKEQQRWKFVCGVEAGSSIAQACRRFGISRKTGHKWLRRFCGGAETFADRTRRPRRPRCREDIWRQRLLAAKRKRRRWGARLLRWQLERSYVGEDVPSVRTLHRWLFAARKTRRHKRRARIGPIVVQPPRLVAIEPNDVWSVDFKGRSRTADGSRIDPLTVRDLATRFGLEIRQLRRNDDDHVRRAFVPLFRRYGLPKAIQADNGPPFGGDGALGLSRLSVWWQRLGIHVQLGRPGCPQDNASHEQWHSVISAETFQVMSTNRAAQQRRFAKALRDYNSHRPHSSLGMVPPVELYRPSPRVYPGQLPVSTYHPDWARRKVDRSGKLFWAGRQRLIGRAFASQHVGLQPINANTCAVYLDAHLLGTLVATDPAGMRPVMRTSKRSAALPPRGRSGEEPSPSPNPSHSFK
jgi:transposase InsO family protein